MKKRCTTKVFLDGSCGIEVVYDKKEADIIISDEIGKSVIIKGEDEYILEYLKDSYIDCKHMGSEYLLQAILIVMKKFPNISDKYVLFKDIYPIIANKYGIKVKSVAGEIERVFKIKGESYYVKKFINKYRARKVYSQR